MSKTHIANSLTKKRERLNDFKPSYPKVERAWLESLNWKEAKSSICTPFKKRT